MKFYSTSNSREEGNTTGQQISVLTIKVLYAWMLKAADLLINVNASYWSAVCLDDIGQQNSLYMSELTIKVLYAWKLNHPLSFHNCSYSAKNVTIQLRWIDTLNTSHIDVSLLHLSQFTVKQEWNLSQFFMYKVGGVGRMLDWRGTRQSNVPLPQPRRFFSVNAWCIDVP